MILSARQYYTCLMFPNNDTVNSSGGSQSVLKKQLQDYRNERDTLRVFTYKLNVELSRYQAKFRHLTPSEVEGLPGLPMKGPKPSWLLNTKYLAPLLVAYDDQLREREDIVNNYQEELSHLQQNVEDVVKENERLHLRIEQTDVSGPTNHATTENHIIDWERVKIVDKEPNQRIRHIKEAIWIRKTRTPINRDEGSYQLPHVYDDVIQRHRY
ncbi:Centrosomal protein of 89 kDa [Lamellibrachia satsuma]|nr:Centrosomal protein of 89 kDa [Lamellibrachia satsuma]